MKLVVLGLLLIFACQSHGGPISQKGSSGLGATPAISVIEAKCAQLKRAGLLIWYSSSLHRTPFSRYEAGVMAHSALDYVRSALLGHHSSQLSVEEVKLFSNQFESIEFLCRAVGRELNSMGASRTLLGQMLDETAKALSDRGQPVRRFDEIRFPDVPKGHWADHAVHELRKAGIIWGYPDGRMTRKSHVGRHAGSG